MIPNVFNLLNTVCSWSVQISTIIYMFFCVSLGRVATQSEIFLRVWDIPTSSQKSAAWLVGHCWQINGVT